MSPIKRRIFMQCAGVFALAGGLLVAGCGKKEEAAATAASGPAAAASVASAEPLKIGFIYVGPVGDAGWTFAHDTGRKAIEAKYGDKIKTTFVEKVPEGPDAERVIRDLVAQGNKVIVATSFGYGDAMEKVAKDHPDAYFEHATGFKTAPNLRVFEGRFYEDAYLAGIVAGKMTKTGTLGFVGSFPIPEVMRNLNAYLLGAQTQNPNVKLKVVWVGNWFDPPKETEAAQTLINGGADVLLQNTDSSAVLQTAEKAGKHAFGWDSDMSMYASKAHLGSAVLNWAVYYEKVVDDVLNNKWKTEVTRWGTKEGLNDFVKVLEVVPEGAGKAAEEAKKAVEAAKAGLKDGSVAVFKGPLVDNTGKEVLPTDAVADDAWMAKVDFYLRGVEGKAPSGR